MSSKLREALCKIRNTLDVWDWGDMQNLVQENIDIIDKALAEPNRNCDVGSAKEQEKRFVAFCNKYNDKCSMCPLQKSQCGDCIFAWSQMPYEG